MRPDQFGTTVLSDTTTASVSEPGELEEARNAVDSAGRELAARARGLLGVAARARADVPGRGDLVDKLDAFRAAADRAREAQGHLRHLRCARSRIDSGIPAEDDES